MKKLLLFIFVLSATFVSEGQTNYINVCSVCAQSERIFGFGSSLDSAFYFLDFDTSQSNNIWQIGTPGKTIFTYGYQSPRALVTDTANPYPVNNISSFQFAFVNCSMDSAAGCYMGMYSGMEIYFYHRFETDDGIDGGTIEVSHDNGVSWFNIIQDTVNPPATFGSLYSSIDTVASLEKPGFSGSSGGWSFFVFAYSSFYIFSFDTTIFRFTFASDSIQTNKDGWMFGQIGLDAMPIEDVAEFQKDDPITIIPNPATDEIKIFRRNLSGNEKIQILSFTGQIILDYTKFNGAPIDVSQLSNGIYLLKYSNRNYSSVKKFIVQR